MSEPSDPKVPIPQVPNEDTQLTANALKHRPPLGFFRNFVLIHGGEHDNTLDLKHRGLVPIIDIARVAALSAGIAPELLMVPAAMTASCAFMLPVATAPNSVVYGSGRVPIRRMAREGVVLNFVGVLVVATLCYWLLV